MIKFRSVVDKSKRWLFKSPKWVILSFLIVLFILSCIGIFSSRYRSDDAIVIWPRPASTQSGQNGTRSVSLNTRPGQFVLGFEEDSCTPPRAVWGSNRLEFHWVTYPADGNGSFSTYAGTHVAFGGCTFDAVEQQYRMGLLTSSEDEAARSEAQQRIIAKMKADGVPLTSDLYEAASEGVLWTTFHERETEFVVPIWLVLVLTASGIILSVWRMVRKRRYRTRREKGLCLSCGYDLRGTPGRCSECGFGHDLSMGTTAAG
jgi:hypothetical protein